MAVRPTGRYFFLKLIFPLIYAGFFVVQLFINFDTALTQTSERYQFTQYRETANHSVTFNKTRNGRPVKTKFRLNKRFQPAAFAAGIGVHCIPATRFLNMERFRCVNPFIKNPLLDTRLLRGPPFVV
jgi:hypothetical protein